MDQEHEVFVKNKHFSWNKMVRRSYFGFTKFRYIGIILVILYLIICFNPTYMVKEKFSKIFITDGSDTEGWDTEEFLIPINECETIFGEVKLYCNETKELKKNLGALNVFSKKYKEKNVNVDDLAIVTAFSKNHLHEALCHCSSFINYPEFKQGIEAHKIKYIAYLLQDLTINSPEINDYQKKCPQVEFRHLDFSKYPDFVKNLNEYRWKPLIIAEILATYDLVFYADTSLAMRASTETTFSNLIQDLNNRKPYDIGILMPHRAEHSILATTNPKMYEYLPLQSSQRKVEMFGATTFLWKKTRTSLSILKRWVGCSFVKNCMAPQNSFINCNFKTSRFDEYVNCHRFDQSALNILLANTSNGNNERYANHVCAFIRNDNTLKNLNASTSCYVQRNC